MVFLITSCIAQAKCGCRNKGESLLQALCPAEVSRLYGNLSMCGVLGEEWKSNLVRSQCCPSKVDVGVSIDLLNLSIKQCC